VLNAGNYRNLQYYPLPTNPTATLRIDHKFSDKAWIYGRMTRTIWDISGPPGTLDTYPFQSRYRYDSQWGLAFTYMITPNLVSETHYGYSADDLPLHGGINGLQQAKDLGLTGLAPNLPDVTGTYNVHGPVFGEPDWRPGSQCVPATTIRFTRLRIVELVPWPACGEGGLNSGATITSSTRRRPTCSATTPFPIASPAFLLRLSLGIPTTAQRLLLRSSKAPWSSIRHVHSGSIQGEPKTDPQPACAGSQIAMDGGE
jgi:hypothetical protein